MEDRETARIRKYGESKTTRIMMASIPPSLLVRDLENFRPMDFFRQSVPIGRRLGGPQSRSGQFGEAG